jgi:hypothetical protein
MYYVTIYINITRRYWKFREEALYQTKENSLLERLWTCRKTDYMMMMMMMMTTTMATTIMMICLHSFVFQSVTWGRVIFGKPLFVQILKFLSSNGTQTFFTAFFKACNWPLS